MNEYPPHRLNTAQAPRILLLLWALHSELLLACGVAPHDADIELDRLAANPSEWCGADVHEIGENAIEKAIPDDYGITSTYGCNDSGSWPGGYCWVPADTTIVWKNSLTSGDPNWNLDQTNAMNELEARMDGIGWNLTISSSNYDFETRADSTHPQGYLGAMTVASYFTTSTPQGTARWFTDCTAHLYKTHIEANTAYQSANANAKATYRRNLYDHENSHCTGLAHCIPGSGCNNFYLMGQIYSGPPGAWWITDLDPTPSELSRMDAWVGY